MGKGASIRAKTVQMARGDDLAPGTISFIESDMVAMEMPIQTRSAQVVILPLPMARSNGLAPKATSFIDNPTAQPVVTRLHLWTGPVPAERRNDLYLKTTSSRDKNTAGRPAQGPVLPTGRRPPSTLLRPSGLGRQESTARGIQTLRLTRPVRHLIRSPPCRLVLAAPRQLLAAEFARDVARVKRSCFNPSKLALMTRVLVNKVVCRRSERLQAVCPLWAKRSTHLTAIKSRLPGVIQTMARLNLCQTPT
jgi:hypothetical protein